jgi:hypothetical protein
MNAKRAIEMNELRSKVEFHYLCNFLLFHRFAIIN